MVALHSTVNTPQRITIKPLGYQIDKIQIRPPTHVNDLITHWTGNILVFRQTGIIELKLWWTDNSDGPGIKGQCEFVFWTNAFYPKKLVPAYFSGILLKIANCTENSRCKV